MSAGTLTLTNKSAAVSGSGTAFTTELAAGDFIVVTVGGIPYTLPVKTVNSNTSLTLVSNFTGPTQSGAAWSAVPRVALNMVTAALVAQSAEALRGLNYDKQNWQSIFSGTGTATVRLPDGSSFTGPAWGGITDTLNNINTALNGKLEKQQNLKDLADKSIARSNLGLGNSATYDVGIQSGKVALRDAGFFTSANEATKSWGFFYEPGNNSGLFAPSSVVFARMPGPTAKEWAEIAVDYSVLNRVLVAKASWSATSPVGEISIMELWHNKNTTVDSNGFIKRASPVVKIFGSGEFETNDESDGCTVEHIGVGLYRIRGCVGLNSDAAWGGIDGGFEIPVDRNKQPRIWLDYEVNADGTVLVRTYHRVHFSAPEFARNRIGHTDINRIFTETVTDGEPVDIPADSFVSVRVEMPENSIWHQKQKDTQVAMDKTERERQQNQQDTQS